VQPVSSSLLPPHPCQFILALLARLGQKDASNV